MFDLRLILCVIAFRFTYRPMIVTLPLPNVMFPTRRQGACLSRQRRRILTIRVKRSRQVNRFVSREMLGASASREVARTAIRLYLNAVNFSLHLRRNGRKVANRSTIRRRLSICPMRTLYREVKCASEDVKQAIRRNIRPNLGNRPNEGRANGIVLRSNALRLGTRGVKRAAGDGISR